MGLSLRSHTSFTPLLILLIAAAATCATPLLSRRLRHDLLLCRHTLRWSRHTMPLRHFHYASLLAYDISFAADFNVISSACLCCRLRYVDDFHCHLLCLLRSPSSITPEACLLLSPLSRHERHLRRCRAAIFLHYFFIDAMKIAAYARFTLCRSSCRALCRERRFMFATYLPYDCRIRHAIIYSRLFHFSAAFFHICFFAFTRH